MEKLIKKIFEELDYLLYKYGIKKNHIRIHSVDETIDELLTTNKSMVRFGDGEIALIRGHSLKLQKAEPEISEGLKPILAYSYDDLIVTIPEIFGDLNMYVKKSRDFWKDHLFFNRKIYRDYCNKDRIYYNTTISRFYCTLSDKTQSKGWIEKIKLIWKDKDIVVVEGERSHNGVGNDLFCHANSVERIIGPASDAYYAVDKIFEYCKKYPKDRLFLISLGVAAKFLTQKLFLEGYRVIDIGNLDMEYEWYLAGASEKTAIPKHEIIGEEANIAAGYTEYLSQIHTRIE